MGRERKPLRREYEGKAVVNVAEIWRNPDIQDEVAKECKRINKIRCK